LKKKKKNKQRNPSLPFGPAGLPAHQPLPALARAISLIFFSLLSLTTGSHRSASSPPPSFLLHLCFAGPPPQPRFLPSPFPFPYCLNKPIKAITLPIKFPSISLPFPLSIANRVGLPTDHQWQGRRPMIPLPSPLLSLPAAI
jgi:hypothetical protein